MSHRTTQSITHPHFGEVIASRKIVVEGVFDGLNEAWAVRRPGGPVVLVADDEPDIRAFVRMTLEAKGCMVLCSDDAERALAQSRQFKDDIHLLVSDFQMPGMNGAELIKLISEERPGISTLLMSGSTVEVCPAQALLRKPFGPAQLTDAVKRLLLRAEVL